MLSPYEISVLAATVGSGLVAGLCFAFATFIMQALNLLGAPHAIRAMQAINARILRSSALAVWFATLVECGVVIALAEGRPLAIVATALYAVGAVVITGYGNVPLNEELDRVDPDAPGAEDAWRRYRVLWGRWNALRTAAIVLASAGFALAM